jgi:hypothetical protein
MIRRLVVALLVVGALPPNPARADWLIAPFLGTSFAAETTFLVFEAGAGRRLTVGGTVTFLSDWLLGLEAEVAHTPNFFEGDDPLGLVLTSRMTTVTGNVVVAAPLAVTRESLRPYAVGGLGLMQARSKHAGGLFPVAEDLLGFNVGAGAIGFLTNRTGLRFELRHFKAITGSSGPFARPGVSRLSFWRAGVGVVFRY